MLVGNKVTVYWPADPSGRIKRVLTRSGVRRRYSVPCFRDTERFAHCEAAEEATGAVLLDACFGVIFQEQPARIEYEWRGASLVHYPDALVVAGQVKEFWEFKKDHEAADIVFRRRSERLTELLAPLGFGYRLVAGGSLTRTAHYRNAIGLRRYARLPTRNARWAETCARIRAIGPSRAGVAAAFLPENQRLPVILASLYNGDLVTDMSVPISLDSHVHPPLCTEGGLPWVWELFERSS